MTEFEDVWPELMAHAKSAEFLRPFGRGDRTEPHYDEKREAIAFEDGGSDLIFRRNWERAWTELRRNGELSVEKFGGVAGTHRAALVLPFLADALDLPFERRERRIWLSAEYDE